MPDDAKLAGRREAPIPMHEWGATCGALLEGNQQAYARWVQAMFALSQEIGRFTQARLQEDMTAWSTLATCQSPVEAMECQRRFTAKAAEQYSEEIAKLSQIMMGIAGEGLASAPRRRTHATG